MLTYYVLDGENRVYNFKDELKKIKPKRKDFKKWWKWNKDLKCWELEVSDSVNSKSYREELSSFCRNNNLKIEILDTSKPLTKSLSDFKSVEAFFQYFHNHNQRPKI